MPVFTSPDRGQSSVFHITGRGHCGDHWLCKALNAHPEIFCYRPADVSLSGANREPRQNIVEMTDFLEDNGGDYKAIGECQGFHSSQLRPLRVKYGDGIPVANLLRHPYTWLDYYVRQRIDNGGRPGEWSEALEHEWLQANHGLFRRLGLREYAKEQVDVWAAYQGMWLMRNIFPDLVQGIRQVRIEDLTTSPNVLNELTAYLTKGRCTFTPDLLDIVYGFSGQDFCGEKNDADPETAWESWPEWKRTAFAALVPGQVQGAYSGLGYKLHGNDAPGFAALKDLARFNAKEPPIVFASMMKSGTVLMRQILTSMTGLAGLDPRPAVTEADYADPEMVELRPGTFMSSHLVASPEMRERLRSAGAKVIFQYRNVGDCLISLYHHFLNDLGKDAGRSAGNAAFLASLPEDEALDLMITGFDVHPQHWAGAKLYFRQMQSWMDFAKEWPVHFVAYENLLLDKPRELIRLRKFLGDVAKNADIPAIVAATGFDAMRAQAGGGNEAKHFRHGRAGEHLFRFTRHHFQLLETMIRQFDPYFMERCARSPYSDFYFSKPCVLEFRLLMERLGALREFRRAPTLRAAVIGNRFLRKRLVLMARPEVTIVGLADEEGNAAPMGGLPGGDVSELEACGADCVICSGGCTHSVRQAAKQAAARMGATLLLRTGRIATPEWLVQKFPGKFARRNLWRNGGSIFGREQGHELADARIHILDLPVLGHIAAQAGQIDAT